MFTPVFVIEVLGATITLQAKDGMLLLAENLAVLSAILFMVSDANLAQEHIVCCLVSENEVNQHLFAANVSGFAIRPADSVACKLSFS